MARLLTLIVLGALLWALPISSFAAVTQQGTLSAGSCAVLSFGGSDAGNAIRALGTATAGELAFTSVATSGVAMSVAFYELPIGVTDDADPAAESGTRLVATMVGTTSVPIYVSTNGGVIDVDIDTDGSGGSVRVCAAGYANSRPRGAGAIAVTSYEGMKACLESYLTVDCYVSGEFALPPGANSIAWRTFNATRGTPASGNMANGRDRKTLHCIGGQWYGTNDSVNDAATLTFDFSAIEHDADLVIDGCGINGTGTDSEPVLRLEHATGASGSNLVRVRFVRTAFNESVTPLTSTITTTATFAFSLLSWDHCWFNLGDINTLAPTIRFLGTYGGNGGEGGRIFISNTVAVPTGVITSLWSFWDSTGDAAAGTQLLELMISNSQIHLGQYAYGVNTTTALFKESAAFHFGTTDPASVHLANAKFYASSTASAPSIGSLFRWGYTGTSLPRELKGDASLRLMNSAVVGSIYGIAASGKGPTSVDLRLTVSNLGGLKSLAYADTGATVAARELNIAVTGRQNLPSGVDLPSIFDRTMMTSLASEAIANGVIALNGKALSIVNGMIGSQSGTYFFARTMDAVAATTSYSLFTVPATPTPFVVTRASCITEDTTGSAVFHLFKTANGTDLAAAPQACSYRLTDATATDCTGPSCLAGVDKTATLTVTPDDQSIVCSSTTPSTSFQIDAAGNLRNPVNINHAYKTVDATTITWQPTADVSADLTCTYQSKPVWQTQGNGNNTFDTAAQILGIRAGTGFGASGKTRIMIEATPQY